MVRNFVWVLHYFSKHPKGFKPVFQNTGKYICFLCDEKKENKIMGNMISFNISQWKGYNKLSAFCELHLPSQISSFVRSLLCEITTACLIGK